MLPAPFSQVAWSAQPVAEPPLEPDDVQRPAAQTASHVSASCPQSVYTLPPLHSQYPDEPETFVTPHP